MPMILPRLLTPDAKSASRLHITPPLSLYIHLPWCVKKCPYCDFNSHAIKGNLPEDLYLKRLMQELASHHDLIKDRPLISIFFGGGTPSLFSATSIAAILDGVSKRSSLADDIEITLEANPGTIDQVRFRDFREAGINRLSLGIQSLQDDKLKVLGRIHNSAEAMRAITFAKEAGFTNFNLDLMYGLPEQTIEEACKDLTCAISFQPTHLSWYQLTIEPNTFFAHQPPLLPKDDLLFDIQLNGQLLLKNAGFLQYEVSAYSKPNYECAHNRNYWEFGDYLGIGAGAHSKITDTEANCIKRFSNVKHPNDYLYNTAMMASRPLLLNEKELVFEFMLNALRLTQGVPLSLFTERTGLALETILPSLQIAIKKGLLYDDATHLRATAHGMNFLNDLVALFLEE